MEVARFVLLRHAPRDGMGGKATSHQLAWNNLHDAFEPFQWSRTFHMALELSIRASCKPQHMIAHCPCVFALGSLDEIFAIRA